MIEPTEKDIGRAVVYDPGYPEAELQDGVITSYNEHTVFVRYANQHPGANGQGTNREDLHWLSKE